MNDETLRAYVALMLAQDLDIYHALMGGEHVDPERLRPDWLKWAKRHRYVRLSSPLELLEANVG